MCEPEEKIEAGTIERDRSTLTDLLDTLTDASPTTIHTEQDRQSKIRRYTIFFLPEFYINDNIEFKENQKLFRNLFKRVFKMQLLNRL